MIKPFSDISNADVPTCGGKGASLGELLRAGIPVPPGFVLTTASYGTPASEQETELLAAFDALGFEYVAVRSSATCEDSIQDSFAGQFDTFLNTTRATLIENVQRCLDSVSSERITAYLAAKGIPADRVKVAVVVQAMVDSVVSGVAFTANPVTNERGECVIEAGWGLGEAIVSGMITPDNFVVQKETQTILSTYISEQHEKIVRGADRHTQTAPVPEAQREVQKLANDRVLELAALCTTIETHYGRPMDIEWAIDPSGKLWILQARPITTIV